MTALLRASLYLLAWPLALTILIPLLYAVLGGFRDTGQLAQNPVALPDPWVFSNYGEILGSGTFWRQVGNSTLIAVASTLFTVPLAAAAAFVFARFMFPGRELLYTVFTLGLLFPVAVAILPIFIMVRDLGLLDSPLGVALPQAAFGLPLTIVILRPFFAASRTSSRMPRRSTGAGRSGSSGASCCRSRGPCSRPCRCWRSSAAGTRSCSRSSCSPTRRTGRCRSA